MHEHLYYLLHLKFSAIENGRIQTHSKVEAVIRYMWAEDWHEKRWQEFVDYNNKTDELQKMKLLDISRSLETLSDVLA